MLICLAMGAEDRLIVLGKNGPGRGKRVVLISGDEEYRSEQALPQLARILAEHHGFDCTVLFAVDPADGAINPDRTDNIPGLETLDSADLMILFTRFRDLPDAQMKHIVDYIDSGKPIVALRTATHAFDLKSSMGHLRSFLENLHSEAAARFAQKHKEQSPTEWGNVIVCLRDKTLLTKPQEKFIAGLYTLLSDEAVHPLIAKKEAARLSRNMVVEYGLLLLTQLEKAGV